MKIFTMKSAFLNILSLFIIISLSFPASSIFNIPIRDFIFLILLLLVVLESKKTNLYILFGFLSACIYIVFFCFVSLGNFYSTIFLEAKSIVVTILPIILLYQAAKSFKLGYSDFLKCSNSILLGVIFYAIIKVVFAFSSFLFGIDTASAYNITFGLVANDWEIIPGFYRSQYVNDTICLALCFIIIPVYEDIRYRTLLSSCALIAVWVISITSFSRLLIFYSFLLSFIYLIKYMKVRLLFIVVFICAFIFVIYGELIVSLINIRLDVRFIDVSDNERVMQFNCLLNSISENPILGLGMGGFVKTCIRGDIGTEHLYEMQWLSFIMKFGVIGVIPILALYLYPLLRWKNIGLFSIFSYVLFLVSGFTNPYLLSSTTSIIFIGLLLNYSLKVGTSHA
ncbi:O-antigen ligase family protein [Aeromonas jandaei]|uniref:O-antigen ligase family protein n=1 Tax=Aeromonas jandaei TaxID=650 RepID=UPI003B9EB3BB